MNCRITYLILLFISNELCGTTLKEFINLNSTIFEPSKFITPSIENFQSELQIFVDRYTKSDFSNPIYWKPGENWYSKNESLSPSSNDDYCVPYVQKDWLPVGAKVCLVGDFHGAFKSLLNIFKNMQKRKLLDENYKIIDHRNKFYFLGDYTDRGPCGTEVLYALALFANENPNNVVLHRGNHETNTQNGFGVDAFWNELSKKYSRGRFPAKFAVLTFYEHLPLATYLICGKNIIHCSHAGYSKQDTLMTFVANPSHHFELISQEQVINFVWDDFTGNLGEYFSKKPNASRNFVGDFVGVGKVQEDLARCNNWLNDQNSELQIKCLFRGHQDSGFGLALFHNLKKTSVLTGNTHHRNNANLRDWKTLTDKNCASFNLATQIPIFTLNTAFELNKTFVCGNYSYCILDTAENYKDWVLTPIEG